MLGSSEIAHYLDQCNLDPVAIDEVVSGYIVWKLIRGASTARVLAKLRTLIQYLRFTYVHMCFVPCGERISP